MYAISNPLIAEALKGRLPIWVPGGALSQFESLIDAYGLTRLDYPHGQVLDARRRHMIPDLSQIFSGAVDNLQADLAMSDPAAEASLSLSWETLAGFRVAVLPDLRVRLVEETQGTDEKVSLDAWLDPAMETLYVTDGSAAGKPSSGGYAIASVFTEDSRRISHDWVAAWSAAEEGTGLSRSYGGRLEAEQKKKRDEAIDQSLHDISERGKAGRKSQGAKRTASSAAGGSSAEPPTAKSKPPRLLIDPDELELQNDDGVFVGQEPDAEGLRAPQAIRSAEAPGHEQALPAVGGHVIEQGCCSRN